MFRPLITQFFLFLFAGLSFSVLALDPVYTGNRDNVAIKGYDTVAYFTENKAVKGSPKFTTEYMGANWQFSSLENLQTFIASPEQYAPQYGGYCAYAVARGTTASIQPKMFSIHEGKLYLNYNKGVRKRWLKDKEGYVEKADQNWPDLLNK